MISAQARALRPDGEHVAFDIEVHRHRVDARQVELDDELLAGAQNLRAYERHGPLDPGRTDGGTRRYSTDDLDRLRRISELLALGLNLAGIALVLDLETDNAALRAELDDRAP